MDCTHDSTGFLYYKHSRECKRFRINDNNVNKTNNSVCHLLDLVLESLMNDLVDLFHVVTH